MERIRRSQTTKTIGGKRGLPMSLVQNKGIFKNFVICSIGGGGALEFFKYFKMQITVKKFKKLETLFQDFKKN